MSLSQGERDRIVEEERVRAEARLAGERAAKAKEASSPAGILGGLFALGFAYWVFFGFPASLAGGGEALVAQATNPVATLAKFKKVQTGMTLGQVESIMGAKGEPDAEAGEGGAKLAIYSWTNPGLANLGSMNVTLQNGRVMAKSQFGLK